MPLSATDGSPDLSQLGIRDLLQVPVVSVSKRARDLSRTAAAVYVITQEDIRRSAASSVPELLRTVPGLHVARIDANKWAIGIRGSTGRYCGTLLVMVDGRSVHSELYGGVYWESLLLPLHEIDRIEVVRGPGATMWGANAMDGVVNIITKGAGETQGMMATTAAGTRDRAAAAVRYGSRVGQDFRYRLSANGSVLAARSPQTSTDGGDGWHSARASFRGDGQTRGGSGCSLQSDLYSLGAESQIVEPTRVRPFQVTTPGRIGMSGGSAQMRWVNPLAEGTNLSVEASFTASARHEISGTERRKAAEYRLQNDFSLPGRQHVTWGVGLRKVWSHVWFVRPATGSAESLGTFDVFAEDELELWRERLWVSAGTKFEKYTATGWEPQPRVRLLFTPGPGHQIWTSISRALRNPSRIERESFDFDVALVGAGNGIPSILRVQGDPSAPHETMRAVEAGYRCQPGASLSFDLALYWNRHTQRRTGRPGSPQLPDPQEPLPAIVIPAFLKPSGNGSVRGGELSATWMATSRWKLTANYSYASSRFPLPNEAGSFFTREGAYPRNQVNGRSYLDLPSRFSVDAALYYVSPLEVTRSGRERVPAAPGLRGDLRVSRRFHRGIEWTFGADHVFGPARAEYVLETGSFGSLIGRNVFMRLTWTPTD